MKWRIILPNPAGDGGFQGISLPMSIIIFCFASLQAGRAVAGLASRQVAGARLALGDLSLGSRSKQYCKGSASSLHPNSLERALDAGL